MNNKIVSNNMYNHLTSLKPMLAIIQFGTFSTWVLGLLKILNPIVGAFAGIIFLAIQLSKYKKQRLEVKEQEIKIIMQETELEHLKIKYKKDYFKIGNE